MYGTDANTPSSLCLSTACALLSSTMRSALLGAALFQSASTLARLYATAKTQFYRRVSLALTHYAITSRHSVIVRVSPGKSRMRAPQKRNCHSLRRSLNLHSFSIADYMP